MRYLRLNHKKRGSAIIAGAVVFLAILSILVIVVSMSLTGYLQGVGNNSLIGQNNQVASQTTYPSGVDPAQVGICLDAYMKSVVPSSPLIGHGVVFAQAGQQYNVNPALLIAIGKQESVLGTIGLVKNHPYNYFGYMGNGGKPSDFASWDDAINVQASFIRRLMDKGLTTIPQIGTKYAPLNVANDPNNLNANWVPGVTANFQAIINHCSALQNIGTGSGDIVQVAQNEVGVRESNDNCDCGNVTKYGGRAGDKYCAFFASWVYRQAGYNIPSIGGARALYDWFGRNQISFSAKASIPQPGDIIYFSYSHVGIVESYSNGVIHTIEGNTSSHNVARREHSINAGYIVGFGRWKK